MTGPDQANLFWEAAKVFLTLLLFIPFIYLATRFYAQKGLRAVEGRRRLSVAEVYSLGPRQKLVLLEVGQRLLLLGVTDGAINVLLEMDQEDLPALPLEEAPGFAGKLRKALGQLTDSREATDD
ncbi:MAG: flagellar biosynthetic protein FliO [Firmicutes bacterium]|nr:flagellar biosynthetic protein FliO [Bacillota bacterium]